MAFLEIQFPTDISFGAAGGPMYSTDVIILNSGSEKRNQNWSQSKGAWDVSKGARTQAQLDVLIAFFRIAKGRANGFRFKDWLDYQVTLANGVCTLISGSTYQLYKVYTNSAGSENRKITKPVTPIQVYTSGNVLLVLATDYTIDYTTGIITKVSGSVPAKWVGQFDVPARFDTDSMKAGAPEYNSFEWGQIPVIELPR